MEEVSSGLFWGCRLVGGIISGSKHCDLVIVDIGKARAAVRKSEHAAVWIDADVGCNHVIGAIDEEQFVVISAMKGNELMIVIDSNTVEK